MSMCGICQLSVVRAEKDKIGCRKCANYFHGKCVNLTATEIDLLSDKSWMCGTCTAEFRLSRGSVCSTPVRTNNVSVKSALTIDDGTTQLTVAHLDQVLAEFKKDIIASQKQNYEDLLSSVGECKNKLTNYNEILGRQDELIKEQNEIIQQLQKENELLKNKLAELDARVEDQEQYSRRNTVEVFGIPESQGENAENLVLNVCKELGVKISAEAISVAHRLRKFGNQRSAGIIVKFVRRKDADELLKRRKEKRNLTSQDVGFPGDKSPVFIDQSLAPGRRRLFTAARKIRTQENLRYVWVDRSGVIKLRATENSRVISIRTHQDLIAFVSDLRNK